MLNVQKKKHITTPINIDLEGIAIVILSLEYFYLSISIFLTVRNDITTTYKQKY